jgi:uncharacterized membrane protein YbhN (UPF0104 family)
MRRRALLSLLGVGASLLGLYLLFRVVRRYDMDEIVSALASVSVSTVVLALLFTVLAYVFLIGAEYLAVSYTRRPVALARVARTAIAALGIGHSIGIAALSSGTVRYRMYRHAGLNFASLGRILLFSGVTVALGMATVGSLALFWHGARLAQLLGVSAVALMAVASLALLAVAAYLLVCAAKPRRFHIRHFHIDVPSLRLACGQVFFGSGYLLSVAAVLYASLRSFTEADYPTVAALYVGADMSALIGHVPGGWGVIEYVITSALEGPQLLAGLIIFRAAYYLLPLAVGVVVFILDEVATRRTSQRMMHSAAMPRH